MENLRELLNSFTEGDYPNKVNLHIHTTFSDGKGNPEQIIASAKENGYKLISITDHNTVEAHKNMLIKKLISILPVVLKQERSCI